MPDPRWQGPPWARDWQGGPGWGRPSRHMFRRLFGFLFFLVLIGTLIGAVIATGFLALGRPHRWVVVGLTVLVLGGIAFLGRTMFRRTWAPVGELIDATRRLGEGDSGVRLSIRGPGPFAAVGGSFNRMAERLEEEDERRRRLFADISHELRTPMTVIRGQIEAVLDGLHPPESLSNVIDEVDLIDRLLDDLRVLALAEAGRLRLELEPTDITALVDDVVSSFSRTADEQSVTMRVDAAPGIGEFEVDPHRLHQVLSNLVSNALHQMRSGGNLTVEVRKDGDWVLISVADTGPGLPRDQLDHVFERFVRAGDSAGTGLGLSISRDLVEAHGGTLTAANRPTGGAVFEMRLPRR